MSNQAEKDLEYIANANDIRSINYHSAPTFMTDSTLFKDIDHLNERVARILTKMVYASLH